MGFFLRWVSFKGYFCKLKGCLGFFSTWILQIFKLMIIKQWARLLHKCFNQELCLKVIMFKKLTTRTSLFNGLYFEITFANSRRGDSFWDGLLLVIELTEVLEYVYIWTSSSQTLRFKELSLFEVEQFGWRNIGDPISTIINQPYLYWGGFLNSHFTEKRLKNRLDQRFVWSENIVFFCPTTKRGLWKQ